MAANFWQSSHCEHWLVDKSRVFRSNPKDLELFGNRNDILLLRRYFMDFIHHLGLRLGLRQRVIATAQIFFKRFYLQYSFVTFDPRLSAPTMLFVAAKVEECPVNARIFLAKLNRMEGASLNPPSVNINTGNAIPPTIGGLNIPSPALVNQSTPNAAAILTSPTFHHHNNNPSSHHLSAPVPTAANSSHNNNSPSPSPSPTPTSALPYMYEMEDLLEMEFAILVGLKYDLIVYHPYRPLIQFLSDMKQNECLQMAWEIVNDSYRLDLPLIHPPYLIAIAAIYITCNFQEKEYRTWFKTLNVEQEKIVEISRELLQLWDDAENYTSAANQAKILTLLCKLNEKKFQTLAQLGKVKPHPQVPPHTHQLQSAPLIQQSQPGLTTSNSMPSLGVPQQQLQPQQQSQQPPLYPYPNSTGVTNGLSIPLQSQPQIPYYPQSNSQTNLYHPSITLSSAEPSSSTSNKRPLSQGPNSQPDYLLDGQSYPMPSEEMMQTGPGANPNKRTKY